MLHRSISKALAAPKLVISDPFFEARGLDQWFLNLLEVPNPTSSIHAFIEPFIIGNIKCVFSFLQIQNLCI